MKRLIAFLLTLIMVATMGIVAFAEKGGFVNSPSANPTPKIEDYDCNGDCPSELVITPYSDRESLDPDEREDIENAYDDIINIEASELKDIIDGISKNSDIPSDKLLVSDLFNLGIEGCEDHAGHMPYKVELSSDAFENFAGLVNYKDGKWVEVKGVEFLDGNVISFSYDGYGPFAVIVDTTDSKSPVTGDNGVLILCAVIMAISAVGFVSVLVASKKKKAVQGR